MRVKELIKKTVPPDVLQHILDYDYDGSIDKFIFYNGISDEDDFSLVNQIRLIVAEYMAEMDKEERERSEEQERLAALDEQIRIWREQIRPIMDRAVRYAERFPRRYSVRYGASSTYIHGPGGTIRFSDHPRPVEDWDDEGRPIYRGGIARSETSAYYGQPYDAPDFSVDPETIAGITWQDVESMLESIGKETEDDGN